MKNKYEAPKLIIHGTVEDMTQMFGELNAADMLWIGNHPIGPLPGFDGSRDGIIRVK